MKMLDEHEVLTLWYNPEINRFMDEFGSIIHDIWRIITPGQYKIFKETQFIYLVPDVTNSFLVEMIYGDEK